MTFFPRDKGHIIFESLSFNYKLNKKKNGQEKTGKRKRKGKGKGGERQGKEKYLELTFTDKSL